MSTATLRSSVELKGQIATLAAELESTQSRLPQALRNAAQAFLGGASSDEVQSVRTQIRRVEDLLAGMRDLATRAELHELSAEIGRRERKHEKDAERLVELRAGGTRADAVIAGTGARYGAEVRADREDRNAAFAVYEAAHLEHIAETKAIAALVARRDELEASIDD